MTQNNILPCKDLVEAAPQPTSPRNRHAFTVPIEVGATPPALSTLLLCAKRLGLELQTRRTVGVSVVAEQEARHGGSHDVIGSLSEIQIDHTPIDMIVLDRTHRYVLGRPWLTLVICTSSRAILGFYLSFDAPSISDRD